MEWNEFLNRFAGQPLFHSSMLEIFPDPPSHRQVQLSRWVKVGKLTQIRRGWYMIQKPWRGSEVPIAVVANRVVEPSYLSLEWALQYYGMIPEHVFNPTSVTTSRGGRFAALDALLLYHHVQPSFFNGYLREEFLGHQINVASPEKALFDKLYLFLRRSPFSMAWLRELRLQNLEIFNIETFKGYVASHANKKLRDAVEEVCGYVEELKEEGW